MHALTLPGPWHNLLLAAHIAAAVGVLGADLVLLALGIASVGGADPLTVYPAARLAAAWVVAPLAVVTLGCGLLLGLMTPWGLFQYWWVVLKLAIVLALTGAVLFVLVPALGATADAVSGPAARALSPGERIPLVAAPAVASTLLAVALLLAIFKPPWRLRAGSPLPSASEGQPGSAGNGGIGFPRAYDLLLRLMTRGRERRYRQDLIDLAGLAPGQSVLDIGCGTGTQAIAMHRRVLPGGAVAGVDISERMLAAACRKARRAGVDIAFRRADAAQLPFEDGHFDAVTVTTVLHMIAPDRQPLALHEAARVLKPGGRLLLIDYAGKPQERRHWTARHGLHGRFDLHALRELLTEARLDKVDGGPLQWLGLHFLRATRR